MIGKQPHELLTHRAGGAKHAHCYSRRHRILVSSAFNDKTRLRGSRGGFLWCTYALWS